MVYLVNSHTNATRIGWDLWEVHLRFAPGLPPGWLRTGPRPSGLAFLFWRAASPPSIERAAGSESGSPACSAESGQDLVLDTRKSVLDTPELVWDTKLGVRHW